MTEFPDTRSSLLASVKSPENREAWEEFVVTYRPVIYRMARRRGLQDADAQDLVQEVLARVAGAMVKYDQQAGFPFRHWLRRVTRNSILSFLNRQPQDVGVGGTTVHELLAEQPDVPPDFEAELATELLREQFLRAAAIVRTEVDGETWRAFELTVVQGATCDEAAGAIGKSIGTVYAARSRIMKRLRDQVERMGGTDQ